MDAQGYEQCVPQNRDPSVVEQPLIDFSSSYVLRSIDQFPKQGSKSVAAGQNYPLDIMSLKFGAIEDGAMQFSRAGSTAADAEPVVA